MTVGSISRRSFLMTAGAGMGAISLTGCGDGSGDGGADAGNDLIAARRAAAHRRRRIIMNNDGNDTYHLNVDDPITPETFLDKRTTALVGSHVDSVFYCTGVFNFHSHYSEESEILLRHEAMERYLRGLFDMGTDPLHEMARFCHDNGLEVFWSMRMNDNHDSGTPELLCNWKKEHPDYLIGKKGDAFPYTKGKWSVVDFAVPEVRDKVFRIMEDVATRYDVDGIEYDFFRHPAFFKPQFYGEPVTEEHCAMMTDLLTRIRSMTEAVAVQRGRPFLISVRVPDSVEYCRAIGLDLVRWLDDDLIDIVTGSGYFRLEPWENLVTLGDRYDVPVYACFVSRRVMGGGEPEADTSLARWRGEALNAWKAGVDGIYTFNRFNPRDQLFRELGDPALLRTLEYIDQENYAGDSGYLDPGYWLKDGRSFIQS